LEHTTPIAGLVQAGARGRRVSTAGLVSAIAMGFIGALFIFVTPAMLALMGEQAQLDDAQIGYIAAWTINSIAITIGASTFLLTRWRWRLAMGLALGLIAAGYVATAFAQTYPAMAAACCVAGAGGGLAIGFAFAALGRARNPDRAFSIYLVVGAVLGAALLYAAPQLQAAFSTRTLFLAIAVCTLLTGLLLPAFPEGRACEEEVYTGAPIRRGLAVAGVSAAFLIFFAVGAIWSYAERIGVASSLSPQTIAQGLSVGTLAGVVGAGLAGMLPQRWSRVMPIVAGSLCVIAGFATLVGQLAAMVYLGGVVLVMFGWNFLQPLLSGMCSDADEKGRVVCAMGSIQSIGMGLGPAAVAPLIAKGSFTGAIWVASIAMVGGLAFVVIETVLRRSQAPASV
jgi:predicted MFS family arabinose efflux permease